MKTQPCTGTIYVFKEAASEERWYLKLIHDDMKVV